MWDYMFFVLFVVAALWDMKTMDSVKDTLKRLQTTKGKPEEDYSNRSAFIQIASENKAALRDLIIIQQFARGSGWNFFWQLGNSGIIMTAAAMLQTTEFPLEFKMVALIGTSFMLYRAVDNYYVTGALARDVAQRDRRFQP